MLLLIVLFSWLVSQSDNSVFFYINLISTTTQQSVIIIFLAPDTGHSQPNKKNMITHACVAFILELVSFSFPQPGARHATGAVPNK